VQAGCGVLVVDDDAAIRLVCRINLELHGVRVHEAGTLAEARAVVASEPLDVVLLDLHLGNDSGRELLRDLRRERPLVKVALMTGSERGDVSGDAPDAVIGKPFALEELVGTVTRLAAQAR
jgi:two-component system, OmpR family, KDP operon response regulator KdpE